MYLYCAVDSRGQTIDFLLSAKRQMKKDGELWRCSRLGQMKYLNNIVEQDHWQVKRLTGSGAWLWGFVDRPTNASGL